MEVAIAFKDNYLLFYNLLSKLYSGFSLDVVVVALSSTIKVFTGEFSKISDAYCCFSKWTVEFPAGGAVVVGHVAEQGKTTI